MAYPLEFKNIAIKTMKAPIIWEKLSVSEKKIQAKIVATTGSIMTITEA
jgi:hypothetical protein